MVTSPRITLTEATVGRGGQTRLGPISCSIGDVACVAVLGPVGSGKTTLLRALYGLEKLSSGARQNDLQSPHAMSFVFQHPVMLRRSVWENAAYPLKLNRMRSKAFFDQMETSNRIKNATKQESGFVHPKLFNEIETGSGQQLDAKRVSAELERFGLSDHAKAPAQTLSGGQQQKLALLRALITKPKLLFLDEPSTNMDEQTTHDIERCLEDAMAEGTRLVLATHNIAQAERLNSVTLSLSAGVLA